MAPKRVTKTKSKERTGAREARATALLNAYERTTSLRNIERRRRAAEEHNAEHCIFLTLPQEIYDMIIEYYVGEDQEILVNNCRKRARVHPGLVDTCRAMKRQDRILQRFYELNNFVMDYKGDYVPARSFLDNIWRSTNMIKVRCCDFGTFQITKASSLDDCELDFFEGIDPTEMNADKGDDEEQVHCAVDESNLRRGRWVLQYYRARAPPVSKLTKYVIYWVFAVMYMECLDPLVDHREEKKAHEAMACHVVEDREYWEGKPNTA